MTPRRRDALVLAALLAVLAALGLARPLLPIDETRYAAVAWEMWTRGDFLVPHLNGEPYHHKPPLLFWLLHAGWALWGVNEWWPRLISPLFAAAALALTARLAHELWPQRPDAARIAPFVLLSSLLYTYFATALMFDAMQCAFVALGLLGLVRAWRCNASAAGFALFGLGMAGALYAKGPVALIHLLPAALLAPWWMRAQRPRWGRWAAGTGLALAGAAVAILAWAVPAGIAGGQAYRDAIFWGQSAGRMVDSFAHAQPWWFYTAWLPAMLSPWLLWPRLWRGLRRSLPDADDGMRLLAASLLVAFVFFTLVSGKRWHYLLPEFPLFALLAARALTEAPAARRASLAVPALELAALGTMALAGAAWLAPRLGQPSAAVALGAGGVAALACGAGLLVFRPGPVVRDAQRVAVAALIASAALLSGFDRAMREPYDMHEVAAQLARYEREQRPLAIVGDYHGQWTFVGRLRRPIVELSADQLRPWLDAHPQGRVLFIHRQEDELPATARVESRRRYRGGWLALLAPA